MYSFIKRISLLSLTLIILIPSALYAAPVDKTTARTAALHFFELVSRKTVPDSRMEKGYEETYNGKTTIYIFTFAGGGFVILSADDAIKPILGYSPDAPTDYPIASAELKSWLNHYGAEIAYSLSRNLIDAETKAQWSALVNKSYKNYPAPTVVVAALLQTEWNQDAYYNANCPAASGGPDGRAYAGCVATAIGQIMKYHNSPCVGVSSHSYYLPGVGTLSANFGSTTYHFENMPNKLTDYNADVALFLYHAGVAVDMDYAADGSGAAGSATETALERYFGYTTNGYKNRQYTSNWKTLLKNDLNAKKPVYYDGAASDGSSAHAFVCDGYDSDDNFHFNWGWSGYYNGFFSLDAMTPTSDANFNYYQGATFNITPGCKTQLTVNYRCSDTNCGGFAQMKTSLSNCQKGTQGCVYSTGSGNWVTMTQCLLYQVCEQTGTAQPACKHCPDGCKTTGCVVCNPGAACCDADGHYKSADTVCKAGTDAVYGCQDSACGGDVYVSKTSKFCSGKSALCDGESKPEPWTVSKECQPNQTCKKTGDKTAECSTCPHGCVDGACCECEFGPCCDGCQYKPSTAQCEDEESFITRCDAKICGSSISKSPARRYCKGNTNACDGALSGDYGEWALQEVCGANQSCSNGLDGEAKCSDCPMGCKDGECCVCNSGPCCDGCNYKTIGDVCNANAGVEYSCSSQSCGGDVIKRSFIQFCPGIGQECSGRMEPTEWSIAQDCADNAGCFAKSKDLAECAVCPMGCVNGSCCECNAGPCCDGCRLLTNAVVCDENAGTAYACSGTCGGVEQAIPIKRFCSGSGAQCDGRLENGTPIDAAKCGGDEICQTDGTSEPVCVKCNGGCADGQCKAPAKKASGCAGGEAALAICLAVFAAFTNRNRNLFQTAVKK